MIKLKNVLLYNEDCFETFKKLENKSIDLFLLDLPYNQIACEWDDEIIPLDKMWDEIKRILKENGTILFFCTARFGYNLIKSNPKWFRYDLIWKKSRKVGFLNSNKMPLRQHELIYVFSNPSGDDIDLNRNKFLREYAEKVKNYIGKTKTEIINDIGYAISRFLRYTNSQFWIPSNETYKKLIELYNIDKMPDFLEYEKIKELWDSGNKKTYNLQMTTGGKPYVKKDKKHYNTLYGDYKDIAKKNNGERKPTSILEFNNPNNPIHPTQKPVELCEWLIKTYSNENQYIMDFTMGSGTTGIACINTNRNFIGVEKDKKIFESSKERILKHINKSVAS